MKKFVFIALFTLLAAACSTSKPVVTPEGAFTSSKNLEQIGNTIESAAKFRGWAITDKKPGKIEATLVQRTHKAVVDIIYTATTYKIVLKDAVDLDYNPASGSVHRNYNRWVSMLDRDIRSQL